MGDDVVCEKMSLAATGLEDSSKNRRALRDLEGVPCRASIFLPGVRGRSEE